MDTNPRDERKQKHDFREDLRLSADNLTRSGRDRTAQEFTRLSSALHEAANKLHENNDYFADFVDTIADKVDSASNYIKNKEPGDLINSVQDFTRKNPYFTIGGMFVAGLAASRFLKSGSTEYHRRESEEGYYESGA